MRHFVRLFFFFVCFFPHVWAVHSWSHVISKTKTGVVTVRVDIRKAPYGSLGHGSGTGFVVDKKQGWIVTNAHVADEHSLQEIRVSFVSGKEVEGRVIYSDPSIDFSVLEVSSQEIPEDVVELPLQSGLPAVEQPILIIGNNGGDSYSIHEGVVSDAYHTEGFFPQHTIKMSLNSRPGSSGSPVMNMQGRVLALNFGGSDTTALALPADYLIDALKTLREKTTPPRYDIGVVLEHYSLSHAARFWKFPPAEVDRYIASYPQAQNKGLCVTRIPAGCAADGLLELGDIICEVKRGEQVIPIGPHLYDFQKLMNEIPSTEEFVLVVWRLGQKKTLSLTRDSLHTHRVNKMVFFGGAIFFESDRYLRDVMGIPLGTICVSNVVDGSEFSELPFLSVRESRWRSVQVTHMNGALVQTLEDLVRVIPRLVEQKKFPVVFKNYSFSFVFNGAPSFFRDALTLDVTYLPYASEPTLYTYDDEKRVWKVEIIPTEMKN